MKQHVNLKEWAKFGATVGLFWGIVFGVFTLGIGLLLLPFFIIGGAIGGFINAFITQFVGFFGKTRFWHIFQVYVTAGLLWVFILFVLKINVPGLEAIKTVNLFVGLISVLITGFFIAWIGSYMLD